MGKLKELLLSVRIFLRRERVGAGIIAGAVGVLCALAVSAILIMNVKTAFSDDTGTFYSSSKTSSALPVAVSGAVSSEEPVQPVEKQIEYKGKSVNVVKPQIARTNSKEDAKNGSYKVEQVKPKAQNTTSAAENKIIDFKKPENSYTGGIDVSSHNGSINWEKVKSAGVDFVMIRCGYRGYLTGKIVTDACFDYNIENAYNNGIKVGLYFYSTATNETEALEEAAYVTELIRAKEEVGISVEYPVAYDFEEFYNNDSRTRAKGLSAAQISKNTDAYLDFIKSAGYTPMLYAGKHPVGEYWQSWVVSKYDFWLAHYTEATEYTGKFFMWQYTSNGAVPGISGRVDLDICGFENGNNLPRFAVCKTAGVKAFAKPRFSAQVLMDLTAGTVYLYRNTYDADYKELKIAGKYYYVFASDLSEIPFEEPTVLYETTAETPLYSEPFDDTYKTSLSLPAGTVLTVKGVWLDKWLKIEYDGKEYYIKPDNLKTTELTGQIKTPEEPPEDTPEEQDENEN